MSESRNEQGQFTTAEPTTGQAAVEETQGYRPMPAPEKPEIKEQSLEEAVANQQASRAEELPQETVEIAYRRPDGEISDPSETVSLERAATDLGKYHTSLDQTAERHVNAEFKIEIDKMRAEALKANPKLAEDLGLSSEDILGAVETMAPADADQAAKIDPATQADPVDAIEGLEPATREALKNPQLRNYLEKNAAETDQFKAAYSKGLENGQHLMRATIASLAPQLGQVPIEHWPTAIAQIAQADPVRGKLIADTLRNWDTIQQQEALQTHYNAEVSRQQLESVTQRENDRLQAMIGDKNKIAEASKEVPEYFREIGIDLKTASRIFSNPEMRSAEVQRVIFDAIQYRKMQQAPKAVPTHNLPPVTRPGTASHRPSGDNSSSVRALERELRGAVGHRAIRLGAQLLAAKRG
jgi:hypothetical protein